MTSSRLTLRQAVVDDLRKRISSGELAVGERLPSITALCERYGVSDITVRAALKELGTTNYVESRRRSGVFVCERSVEDDKPKLRGEKVLALLVPAWDNNFFAGIIHGAEEQAGRDGYRLLVANSKGDTAIEAEQLLTLSTQVAGLMIVPLGAKSYGSYTALLEKGLPFVFLDRRVEKLAVPVVATDNEEGGYLATRHLLECGRRRIYAFSEGNSRSDFVERSNSGLSARVEGSRCVVRCAACAVTTRVHGGRRLYIDATSTRYARKRAAVRHFRA